MLNRLCLTKMSLSPMDPLPRILPLLLSPKVTCPSCLKEMLRNFDLSPVMCLEHPLSKYHCCLLSSKISYKEDFQVQKFGPLMNVGPFCLYSTIESLLHLGIHFINDENPIKEAFINEGRGHSPSHLKFFLLVFSKLKEDIK